MNEVGWVAEFYLLKGMISLTATVLLVMHMVTVWDSLTSTARQARYLTLMMGGALVTFNSIADVSNNSIEIKNMGFMVFAVALLVSAVLSIRDDD